MATIQARTVKGHKYWYLVESRRVDGKPRPIVLAYLGKADDLLQKLQTHASVSVKSYSHGGIAALLNLGGVLRFGHLLRTDVHCPERNPLSFRLIRLLSACTPAQSKDTARHRFTGRKRASVRVLAL